ncbi:MAG: homocysteine S-methyltransferase family protein [Clostridiales bacterium]|nr:homocysteine S-methyltransferase family protein [Clostridiales bacterium]
MGETLGNGALAGFFDSCGVVLFDSAMGTALISAGLPPGTDSAEMNALAPDVVRGVHLDNIRAGCDVITTNTFGVTGILLRGGDEGAALALEAGVRLAREAAAAGQRINVGAGGGTDGGRVLVALGIGPAGSIVGPLGDISYESATKAYALQAGAGAREGADFMLFETFADLDELMCAARAARAVCDLPIIATMTFDAGGHTYMGVTPADFAQAVMAENAVSCGAEPLFFAIGANCALTPDEMPPIIDALTENARGALRIIAQPNNADSPDAFLPGIETLLGLGVSAVGGCCGTTPEMIAEVRAIIDSGQTERKEPRL